MGSDKAQDKDAFDSEMPQYPVQVGNFCIGQHPVTVAEYTCAVRAKAVVEPEDWKYERITEDHLIPLTHANYPVVCITWEDATVYTRWLAHITRQHWRLPTEAEWEKMARWDERMGQSRIYPWGDTFESIRCNARESEIYTTTPVGTYPSGASPYGGQDVAGNVWEWTSSLYRPYPYNQDDGREDQEATERRVW